jgi:hypothetical protein
MRRVCLALLCSWPLLLPAAQVGKDSLPDDWQLDGNTLVLNGAGPREYGFLRIKVYVAALYVAKRDASSPGVLDAKTPKVLYTRFLRDVELKDTLAAWDYYFEQNCTGSCTLPKQQIQAFKALVPVTVAGDTQTYLFRPDGVELLRNDKSLGVVQGGDFARLLLSTWIGEVPTTPALKKALLGQKELARISHTNRERWRCQGGLAPLLHHTLLLQRAADGLEPLAIHVEVVIADVRVRAHGDLTALGPQQEFHIVLEAQQTRRHHDLAIVGTRFDRLGAGQFIEFRLQRRPRLVGIAFDTQRCDLMLGVRLIARDAMRCGGAGGQLAARCRRRSGLS